MSLAAIQSSSDVRAATGVYTNDEFNLSATKYSEFIVFDLVSRTVPVSGQLKPGDVSSTGVLPAAMMTEVTFRVVTPAYAAPWEWGFELRAETGTAIRYIFRSDKTWAISRFEPGVMDAVDELVGSPWETVNASADGPNKLLVLVTDGHINVYLNDVYTLTSLPLNGEERMSINLLGSTRQGAADSVADYTGLAIWTFGQ
jgi:hypothetical protein